MLITVGTLRAIFAGGIVTTAFTVFAGVLEMASGMQAEIARRLIVRMLIKENEAADGVRADKDLSKIAPKNVMLCQLHCQL
ncbi:hypothetical protein V3C41_00455 [Paenarthrobacter nicotinovorans]|uniref:Uncharacterized protein n=1 Tax=Paenarthrobacter nicotinovorans TaxID=29320 RepID=A0ABV0GLY6_PAENI